MPTNYKEFDDENADQGWLTKLLGIRRQKLRNSTTKTQEFNDKNANKSDEKDLRQTMQTKRNRPIWRLFELPSPLGLQASRIFVVEFRWFLLALLSLSSQIFVVEFPVALSITLGRHFCRRVPWFLSSNSLGWAQPEKNYKTSPTGPLVYGSNYVSWIDTWIPRFSYQHWCSALGFLPFL